MKIYLAILVVVFFSSFILSSFAQTSAPIMFVQIIVRDSNDNLISYLEVQKFGYINPEALDAFLDQESNPNDPIFTRNGQKHQLIQRYITQTYDSTDVVSDITLNIQDQNGQLISLVRPIHDGIPGVAGDTLTMVWTFIRPL